MDNNIREVISSLEKILSEKGDRSNSVTKFNFKYFEREYSNLSEELDAFLVLLTFRLEHYEPDAAARSEDPINFYDDKELDSTLEEAIKELKEMENK